MVAGPPLRMGGLRACLRAVEGGVLLSSFGETTGCGGNGDGYSVCTARGFVIAHVFSWRKIRSG